MSNGSTVFFYDGYMARPREAGLELNNWGIFITDLEPEAGNALFFPFAQCTAAPMGQKFFVHLQKNGGPYFEITKDHPLFGELMQAFDAAPKKAFGRLMSQRWPVLVLLLAGLIVGIWFLIAVALPPVVVKIIPVQQEVNLGSQLFGTMVSGSRIDTAATRILQRFADELQLSKKYTITVTVVKEDDINAFALPGGHIVVYSGIIDAMQTPEQLAALLGHEATHVNQRHSLHMIVSGMGTGLFQSLVLGGFGNLNDVMIRNVSSLTTKQYSRSLERQADNGGMEMMLQEHVDPAGMKSLMELLEKKGHNVPGVLSFMSTHPLTTERIKNADQFILEHKSGTFATDSSLTILWGALKKLHEAETSTP